MISLLHSISVKPWEISWRNELHQLKPKPTAYQQLLCPLVRVIRVPFKGLRQSSSLLDICDELSFLLLRLDKRGKFLPLKKNTINCFDLFWIIDLVSTIVYKLIINPKTRFLISLYPLFLFDTVF